MMENNLIDENVESNKELENEILDKMFEKMEVDKDFNELLKPSNFIDVIGDINQARIEIDSQLDTVAMLASLNEEKPKYRVIFTRGESQLVIDDGEFYFVDTVDSKKTRKKISKKQAMEACNEYYIQYILNPTMKQKEISKDITEPIKPIKSKVKAEKENAQR